MSCLRRGNLHPLTMVFFVLVIASIFSCSGPQPRNNAGLRSDYSDRTLTVGSEGSPEEDPAYPKAREFHRFLNDDLSRDDVEGLQESCRKAPTENIFCFSVINREYFEEKVKARKQRLEAAGSPRRSRRVTPRIQKRKVVNWVELRHAPINSTLRGVAAQSPANLELLKDTALKEKNCPNNVAVSVAATLEDRLPEKAKLGEIARLYERGGVCIVNNTGDRENMLTRSAIFYFADKNYADAERLLKEAIGTPNTFVARSLYWLYRVYQERKQEKEAKKVLEQLESEYPFAFHTLMAFTARNQDPGDVLLKKKLTSQITRSEQMPLINPLIEQVEVLHRLGFEASASRILDWAIAESYGIEPEVKIYLAELKKEQGDYHGKISILSDVLYKNPSLVSKQTMELYFPKVFFPIFERQSSLIDPYLLLSIARRESAFNVKAVSSANARGLMQLLPKVRDQLKRENNLFDPEDNVEVGAHYVLKLLKQTEGQVHLALAAYNAGPHKLSQWTVRYPVSDPILFIDIIPYRETREYVASVLRNYYWYRRIHQKDNDLTPQRILELAISKGG